jgi:hypothetical protein
MDLLIQNVREEVDVVFCVVAAGAGGNRCTVCILQGEMCMDMPLRVRYAVAVLRGVSANVQYRHTNTVYVLYFRPRCVLVYTHTHTLACEIRHIHSLCNLQGAMPVYCVDTPSTLAAHP